MTNKSLNNHHQYLRTILKTIYLIFYLFQLADFHNLPSTLCCFFFESSARWWRGHRWKRVKLKAIGGGASLARTRVGTPQYWAPEAAGGVGVVRTYIHPRKMNGWNLRVFTPWNFGKSSEPKHHFQVRAVNLRGCMYICSIYIWCIYLH